jgi:hypothetical protein
MSAEPSDHGLLRHAGLDRCKVRVRNVARLREAGASRKAAGEGDHGQRSACVTGGGGPGKWEVAI